MEAIKFMKELKRYCEITGCGKCEASYACNGVPADVKNVNIVESIEFIEKWSMDNPIKTRQSEFLKLYPNAPLNSNGYLIITPCALNKELYKRSCEICKYKGYSASCDKAKYWNEEVK